MVIEVDGSIHNVKEVIENDMIRQEDIVSFGIRVIRFTNIEVRTDIGSVISRIQTIINELQENQKNNEK